MSAKAPNRATKLLPLIVATAGIVILGATWFLFQDLLQNPEIPWYHWIRPALTVLVGVLCLIAAASLLPGKQIGWDILKAAVAIIPLIFLIGLFIVMIKFAGNAVRWIFDGSLVDKLLEIPPKSIAISAVVLAAICLFYLVEKHQQNSGETPKEKNDE